MRRNRKVNIWYFFLFVCSGILPLAIQWSRSYVDSEKIVASHIKQISIMVHPDSLSELKSPVELHQWVMARKTPTWVFYQKQVIAWNSSYWVFDLDWLDKSKQLQGYKWVETPQGIGLLSVKSGNSVQVVQFIPLYYYSIRENGSREKKMDAKFASYFLKMSETPENTDFVPIKLEANTLFYAKKRDMALPNNWIKGIYVVCTLGFWVFGLLYLRSLNNVLPLWLQGIVLICFLTMCHFYAYGLGLVEIFIDDKVKIKRNVHLNLLGWDTVLFISGVVFYYPFSGWNTALIRFFSSKSKQKFIYALVITGCLFGLLFTIQYMYKGADFMHLALIFTNPTFSSINFLCVLIAAGVVFFALIHIQSVLAYQEPRVWWVYVASYTGLILFNWFVENYTFLISLVLVLFIVFVQTRFALHQTLQKLRWETYMYILFANMVWSGIQMSYFYSYAAKEISETARLESRTIFNKNATISPELLLDIGKQMAQISVFRTRWSTLYPPYEVVYKRLEKQQMLNVTLPYAPSFFIIHHGELVYPKKDIAEAKHLRSLITKFRLKNAQVYTWRQNEKKPDEAYLAVQNTARDQAVLVVFKLLKVGQHQIEPNFIQENVSTKYLYRTFFNNPEFKIWSNQKLLTSGGSIKAPKATASLLPYEFTYEFENNSKVQLTIEPIPIKFVIAHFCMVFLAILFVLTLFVFGHSVYVKVNQTSSSFSTKIQLYIHAAFVIPLGIVCITTYSLISSDYTRNIQLQNREVVKSIQSLFQNHQTEIKDLKSTLAQIADVFQSDIHVYQLNGKLTATNRPQIFDDQYTSPWMDPVAYIDLVQYKSNLHTAETQIGNNTYKTLYFPIIDKQTGLLKYICSIPFYEAIPEQQRQTLLTMASIVNIFTVMFILFMLAGFIVSRNLTIPLNMLTESIRKISFSRENVPLSYKVKDEIGLLVNEYNRMIVKLQESKRALQKTEQEAAWKEMAKQVAHEIKNPLTPMKLSLQSLQMRMQKGKVPTSDIEITIKTLLEQIDILDEIAGSFSAFVQMPELQIVRFDMLHTLTQVATLHQQDMFVTTDKAQSSYWVLGDEKLVFRILQNIYINAIQSVPSSRNPVVKARLMHIADRVRIEIEDNGIGIPDEWKEKVFLPNFSSKENGTGLGLALAKKGMEQMKGSIRFTSHVERGTTFCLEFRAC